MFAIRYASTRQKLSSGAFNYGASLGTVLGVEFVSPRKVARQVAKRRRGVVSLAVAPSFRDGTLLATKLSDDEKGQVVNQSCPLRLAIRCLAIGCVG
jgi:hypothetical protein